MARCMSKSKELNQRALRKHYLFCTTILQRNISKTNCHIVGYMTGNGCIQGGFGFKPPK